MQGVDGLDLTAGHLGGIARFIDDIEAVGLDLFWAMASA
jgi:hypothetical protein